MTNKQIISNLICLLLITGTLACVDASNSVNANININIPSTDDFPAVVPDEVGLNDHRLAILSQMIEAGSFGDIQSLLIVRYGNMAVENYYQGYNRHLLHFTASVTKSVTSLLIGIAIDQGFLDGIEQGVLDKTVLELFREYQMVINADPMKQSLVFRHLLTMSSGLQWDETTHPIEDPRNDYYQAYHSEDSSKYILEKLVSQDPGSVFHDNGGLSMLLSRIIFDNTDLHADEFAEEYLLKPLGITTFVWDQLDDGLADTGGGLDLRPYDLAKIGCLYVNDGKWKNHQVVSKTWIKESTRAWIEAQYINDFDITAHYGFQWWLLPIQGLPGITPQDNDIYMARGQYGQFIFAIPSLEMVVVITSDNEETEEFMMGIYTILYDHILQAVEEY